MPPFLTRWAINWKIILVKIKSILVLANISISLVLIAKEIISYLSIQAQAVLLWAVLRENLSTKTL